MSSERKATGRKRVALQPGDILSIPYAPERSVYGRVVYTDAPDVPARQRRGLYLKVFDRDVAADDDPGSIINSPALLGPAHTSDDLVKDGTWKVVSHASLSDSEHELPHFLDRTGVVDYFHNRVADTPENRQRVIDESMTPPEWFVDAVRAKRGLGEWQPGYDELLPNRRT